MWSAAVLPTLSSEAPPLSRLQPRPGRVRAREVLALSRENPLRAARLRQAGTAAPTRHEICRGGASFMKLKFSGMLRARQQSFQALQQWRQSVSL